MTVRLSTCLSVHLAHVVQRLGSGGRLPPRGHGLGRRLCKDPVPQPTRTLALADVERQLQVRSITATCLCSSNPLSSKSYYLKQVHQPRHLKESARLFGPAMLEVSLPNTPSELAPDRVIRCALAHHGTWYPCFGFLSQSISSCAR